LGYVVDKIFKIGFHNVELSESVESAYHALAADERRWVFRPTHVELTDYHNKRNKALEQVEFATGREFKRDLAQPIEKNPQFFYQVLTTLMIKLPGLIGLVPVYPRRDHPLAKYITWGAISPNRPRRGCERVRREEGGRSGLSPTNVNLTQDGRVARARLVDLP
jgi:hypothetical protein